MSKYSDIEIQTAKNLLEYGYNWIVRNENGRLSAHSTKPGKVSNVWWSAKDEALVCEFVPIFLSIHFGDKEPVSLESIVHPQILDDAEKRYLKGVIRPFRDRVQYITKTNNGCSRGYCGIRIGFTNPSDDIYLPCFLASTMYKGMKLYKNYTLEELGL